MATAGPMLETDQSLHFSARRLASLYESCTGSAADTACPDRAARGAASVAHWVTTHDTATVEVEQLLAPKQPDSRNHSMADPLWLALLRHGHDVRGFEFDPVLPIVDVGLDTLLVAWADPAESRRGEQAHAVN